MEQGSCTAIVGDSTCQLVAELRRIWSDRAVSTLIAVGEVIIRACYGGSLERWRARGANARLRRLERHEQLPFSRKTVHLALHFYDLSQRIGSGLVLSELGVSRVRAVVGLSPAEQEQLLLMAREQGWTAGELATQASERRRQSGRRSGRPPLPPNQRAAKEIRRHLDALDSLLQAECLFESLPQGRRKRLNSFLDDLRNELTTWLAQPSSQLRAVGS